MNRLMALVITAALVGGVAYLKRRSTAAETVTVTGAGAHLHDRTPARIAREEAARLVAATRQRLLGRWEQSFAADYIFNDDGVLILDGPGPADVTGSFEVVAPTRVKLRFPADSDPAEVSLSFFEDKVRLTAVDGKGAGMDGVTLTRK